MTILTYANQANRQGRLKRSKIIMGSQAHNDSDRRLLQGVAIDWVIRRSAHNTPKNGYMWRAQCTVSLQQVRLGQPT